MTPPPELPERSLHDAYAAVETLYHAFLTGLILATTLHKGRAAAAELVYRTFRRQHLEKFLPGLKKLGLDRLPHAVACAQYHYLSNALGGVKVEYMPETDRKAWVRYVPPRWIYMGTAICGVPTEVSRAMLRAWHAHNGVSLANPRLGFVCTKQTTDAQPGLEGYYCEYNRDLEEHERLRFAPDEEGPAFDPGLAPRAEGADWPPERLRKVQRNYAMDYVRSVLPELVGLLGSESAAELGRFCGMQIGMQFYDETAALLAVRGSSAAEFGDYLTRMAYAQDDEITIERDGPAINFRQPNVRVFKDVDAAPEVVTSMVQCWSGLFEGALSVHNRRLRLQVKALNAGVEWRIVEPKP